MKAFLPLLLSLLFLSPAAPARADSLAAAPDAPVYVIPIRGQIEGALLYVIRRGIAEAEQQHAAAILLVMDTPGGTLAAAGDIVRSIQSAHPPVYTFVEKDAFSAGAIIALATQAIYMAPGSVIGDALPIMMSPIGGVQEMSEGVEEKAVSAVSALVRSAAQNAGHDPELAEKMVRRELEYKLGDKIISPAGRLLTLTADEAAQPRPDGQPLLSAGTVSDLPALLERLSLGAHPLVEMRITPTEKLARMIAAAAPILMIIGFLGIYIEVKTPGFGLPGILGAACLALFFWGHHIAGLAGMEDLLLFIAGIAIVQVQQNRPIFCPDAALFFRTDLLLWTKSDIRTMSPVKPFEVTQQRRSGKQILHVQRRSPAGMADDGIRNKALVFKLGGSLVGRLSFQHSPFQSMQVMMGMR